MAKERYIKWSMGRTKPFDLYNPSSTGFERPIAKTVFARNIAKTLGMPGTCVSISGPQSTSTRIDRRGRVLVVVVRTGGEPLACSTSTKQETGVR